MGQGEIIKFLEQHKGKKFNSEELCKGLGVQRASEPLKRLRNTGFVEFDMVGQKNEKSGKYRYRYWVN